MRSFIKRISTYGFYQLTRSCYLLVDTKLEIIMLPNGSHLEERRRPLAVDRASHFRLGLSADVGDFL